ncbi:MAG TPA: TlpA disulfide reductase family protein [Pedobacter sp.]|uniref:TlpA disulfide reductase family protein n=1 Tax=Pedobacter sp. TaxID=1411316 RepID=UPI002CDC33D4|nr:TlpA disulfide reductase family protein [Pedobacter sp.]HMI01063.1 TlpA disulfide reductase family protein [Pedobacter sp.]
MKKILMSILTLLPFMAAAQKNYTISGKLPAVKGQAKAYLVLLKNDAWKEIDSAEIKDGKFQFAGSVNEPQNAILAVRHNGAADSGRQRDTQGFFIENSKIAMAGTDSISNANITGSVADQESHEREAMIKPVTAKIIQLQDKYGKKNSDGTFVWSVEDRKKAGDSVQMLVAKNKDISLKFAETHLNSFMGLYTFNMYVLDNKFDPAAMEPLFNQFSNELKSSPLGKLTVEKIEIGKRRQTGAKATDFTQKDLNDKPFTLSSLRGKYVLVDFWASWCVPCRAENPNVVKAYNELKGKNFEIVGVSLDYPGGKAAWAGAVEKDGLPWIQVSDLKGWKNEVAVMYGINSVPQNLLIDPNGVIIAKNLRGEALTEKLKELIK